MPQCNAISHARYPIGLPLRRTPTPSSKVYVAIASPVSTAASTARRLCAIRFHGVNPSTPIAAAMMTTPAVGNGGNGSPRNIAATTATMSGPRPRASGYVWLKSPS